MSLSVTLVGGPPWGLRVNNDEELRPVVAKILPGGRASVGGIRIGDVIETINHEPVFTTGEAYQKIQDSKGQLNITICRNPENYHLTIRREKLSTSAHSSPVLQRKEVLSSAASVPSSPVLPRTNPYYRNSPIRQIRLDLEGIKGATNNKRQFFEQICMNRSPATDRLLQRKIQMGFLKGLPSESTTTGYDSVCGDFAGGSVSDIHSGRSTPNSSVLPSESDDKTLIIEEKDISKGVPVISPLAGPSAGQKPPAQMQALPPEPANSNEWAMRAEVHNHLPAEGDIEVPGRRSVAALRQAITDKLEMKTPTSSPARPKTPSYNSGRETPTWKAANIKVFEGLEENKPYLGRVLDGPVAPTKYFQGVPPPSYHLSYNPPQVHEPHSKPPLPPVVPPKPSANQKPTITIHESGEEVQTEPIQYEKNSFLNSIARGGPSANAELNNYYDLNNQQSTNIDFVNGNNSVMERSSYENKTSPQPSPQPSVVRTFSENVEPVKDQENLNDDSKSNQTASEFYHSLYSGGSERNVQEIPVQHREQPLMPSDNISYTRIFPEIRCSATINDPRIEIPMGHQPTMTTSCISYFDDDMQTSLTSPNDNEVSKSTDSPPEDPKCSPKRYSEEGTPRRESMDLETSELLKSRSPAPFGTYSTSIGDHYGTVRRRQHSPVTPILLSPTSDGVMSPPAGKGYSYSTCTNDSGFPETPTYKDQTAFDTSSFASTQNLDSRFGSISIDPRNDRTESLMSYSSVDDGTALYAHGLDSSLATPSSRHEQQQLTTGLSTGASVASAPSEQKTSYLEEKPLTEDERLLRQQRIADDDADQMAEMSTWYRNMFKKMHRLDNENESVLRYQLREQTPPTSNISRPITPNTFISRPPSRFECEITPRRAKSVGRVVEPSSASLAANRSALERARTPHFHLPAYKFRHEDSRACLCGGPRCLRCGQPRKELSWNEIDYIYKSLGEKEMNNDNKTKRIMSNIATRCIADRLDSTAKELEDFIEKLDISWKRSNSSPMIQFKNKDKSPSTSLATEIAELKRISKEELMYRQKAERLTEELEQERQRRHGFIPSASPALQKNFDRFEGLINNYSSGEPMVESASRAPSVQTATAVYKFVAKSPRELGLNKGDIIRLHREIDSNWMEGERNGRVGIFPTSYVQVDSESTKTKNKMRAVYPFTSRNANEMSLKLGEVITYRRDIDANWAEGSNHIGEIGIFPKCYVRLFDDVTETPAVIPDRPKTPKLGPVPDFDIEYESPPREVRSAQQQATTTSVHFAPTTKSLPPGDNLPSFEEKPVPKVVIERQFQQPPQQLLPESEIQKVTIPEKQSNNFSGLASLIPRGSETYRAVYAYNPQKEDELELEVDDIIFVVEKCDDGWYIGTLLRNGQFGTFPGNYVQKH